MLRNIFVVAVSCAAACDVQKNKPGAGSAQTEARSTSDAAVPDGPPIEVTGRKLYEDYTADRDAADARYMNRTLLVHAIVKSKGSTVLELMAPAGDHINAWFPDKALAGLRPYQEVFIRCRGDGMLDVPILKDCTIERIVRDDPAAQPMK